jgi:hypothetical protein
MIVRCGCRCRLDDPSSLSYDEGGGGRLIDSENVERVSHEWALDMSIDDELIVVTFYVGIVVGKEGRGREGMIDGPCDRAGSCKGVNGCHRGRVETPSISLSA